jgi:hypothetical protein
MRSSSRVVETEDGDDVLELLVALEHLLHLAGHVVVTLARPRGRGWWKSTPADRPPGRCPAGDLTGELGGGVRWVKVVNGAGSVCRRRAYTACSEVIDRPGW